MGFPKDGLSDPTGMSFEGFCRLEGGTQMFPPGGELPLKRVRPGKPDWDRGFPFPARFRGNKFYPDRVVV